MPPGTRTRRVRVKQCLRSNVFVILTALGIVLGIVIGFTVRPLELSEDALVWLGMPGDVYIRSMKLMVLPLIISSVISGTASLNPKSNGKLSIAAICVSVAYNALGSLLGLVFALIIRPGRLALGMGVSRVTHQPKVQDIFADLIRNLVPDNIVEACFRQTRTQYLEKKSMDLLNVTGGNSTSAQLVSLDRVVGKADGPNILGLIVVCVLIGVAASKSKEKGRRFTEFFTSATEIVIIILRWLMWCVPIGVCSLIAVSLASIQHLEETFIQIGYLVLTITIALGVHQLIICPLILFFLAQRNPFRYIFSLSRAWMIGFSTTSPAIAIPEIIHVCEDVHRIDGRVVRFVVPLCTTISAGGGCVYIMISAMFIATLSGSPLSAGGIASLLVLTIVAAMAIPSVPSAGLVTLIIILTALNLPVNQLSFLFAVEWYLDRIRSANNILNNATAPAVIYRFCKRDLPPINSMKSNRDLTPQPDKFYRMKGSDISEVEPMV